MRKMITLGLALAVISVISVNAEAGAKSVAPCPNCGKYHTTQSYGTTQPAKKQNAFEKMWELEKRKNAWLKRTFLGR